MNEVSAVYYLNSTHLFQNDFSANVDPTIILPLASVLELGERDTGVYMSTTQLMAVQLN